MTEPCYTGGLDGQRQRKEVVHGITNLTTGEADDARLAALVRGHWAIENNVHWVRDVTYREDAHRARTGNAPAVLACIRNLVTTALRLAANFNLAVARRAGTVNSEPSCDYSESSGNRPNRDVTEPWWGSGDFVWSDPGCTDRDVPG